MLTTQDEIKIRKMIRGEFERVGISTSTGLDSKIGRKIIGQLNKLVSYKTSLSN
ncbi:MAG: hypothetical protein LV477_07085 [Candidatus Nitrosotalea sp.]|nr:hypothetical protein [Candidatus Nitrosotalea sp.]